MLFSHDRCVGKSDSHVWIHTETVPGFVFSVVLGVFSLARTGGHEGWESDGKRRQVFL